MKTYLKFAAVTALCVAAAFLFIHPEGKPAASSASDESSAPGTADECFSVSEIPDSVFARMQGKSFKEGAPVGREDLRYIRLLHKDIEGRTLKGEMVVNKAIAEDVLEIFRELYRISYPIERVSLVDDYDADDRKSMEADNSSAFNFRPVAGSSTLSRHAYGLAIDINPLYNPYYKLRPDGSEIVDPPCAREYIDRNGSFPYKITRDDPCCKLFLEHGFVWGGDWQSLKDWQHFEK